MRILFNLVVLVCIVLAQQAGASTIHLEEFDATDGGYTVTSTGAFESEWTWDGSDSWFVNGSANVGAPTHSRLTSPTFAVSADGAVELSFRHRYSIEGGLWDGAAVFVSLNGGAFIQVDNAAFSQNGYTGFGLIGNHALNGGDGYNGDSPGYGSGDFITSIASLGNLNAGDTVSLQFLGAWDEFAKGTEPNWQIDWVQVKDAAPSLPEPTALALTFIGLLGLGYSNWLNKKAG